jgi:hypothetical protein
MSKAIRLLFVTVMVFLFLMASVFTAGALEDGCPDGFTPHMAHDHDEDHTGHLHVGTDTDKNGDGLICVKHATPTEKVHVHIDNILK